MLDVALNTDITLGMHGNGLCWACFMSTLRSQSLNPFGGGAMFPPSPTSEPVVVAPKHKYPLMIEVTSDASFRNEVGQGVNVKNVGNLAGTVCPITSLSIAGTAVDNPFSRAGPEGHRWKEMDVSLNRHALHKVCLLYTSDAADEEDSVDLWGRRIIKQNNRPNSSRSPILHLTRYRDTE
eukprot:TRINITY_DN40931_c0_g1_i1.p2 TRINITY_DN40931_c0_g1~~TRINITY_DN40931_c0_g1_i1.p2  ORF type:complete len:180 (-),score=1.81 TRINITY_DN40931_c0_g1_i1:21-560(-)